MSGSGKVVAVTGSSGYIASWLVKQLLERGYTVKASIRNLDDPRKTQHLLSLDGAKERLHFFEADLLKEGSFDALVHGCHGVFHTASPVSFTVTNPQEELIEPAVKGTLNVLRSCVKSVESIKRVIVTSSIAAVCYNQHVKPGVTTVDETWFSDATYCQDQKSWYVLSKTLAEDAAWKFVKEHGLDMVVINPGLVIGPLLQPNISFSQTVILNLVINGSESVIPNSKMQWVDVRDVIEAHILAFENPSANGRYCVVERSAHFLDIINILRQLFPALQLPNKCEESEMNVYSNFNVSRKKAESLGVKFLPFEVTLKDTVDSLLEMNLLTC